MDQPGPVEATRAAWHSDRAVLAGVIIIAAANGLLWACTIPFNEAPDEAAHFQVVRFILDHGRLPRFSPDELWLHNTAKGFVESYAPFPPLAYFVGALASRLTDGTMWGARLVSVMSYVASVALTFLIARRLLPRSRGVAVGAALVVAFLPQFAFTAAYVNSDAIGVALSALLLYLLVRLHSKHPRAWPLVAIGVTAGALLLTKYTFYPVAAVGLASAVWRIRRPVQALALLASTGATAGWWFARNWVLYGELVPVRVIADAKTAAGGNTLFVPADYGITLLDISTRTDFWWASFTSFVGKFGFLSIELHPAYYIACLALAALAVAGALARLPGARPHLRDYAPLAVGGAGLAGALLFAMASSAYGEYSPQGRYLFGALVPIAIALSAGWTWLGQHARALRFVPVGAALALVALNFVALLGYVVPAYFGDGAGRVAVQLDPPVAGPGGATQLQGWAFIEGASRWRPYSPASVNDYRHPTAEVRVYADAPPPSGRLLGIATHGLTRPDVADFYGGFRSLDAVGYRLDLSQAVLQNRDHTVYVCATSPLGSSACTMADLPDAAP